MTQKEAIEYTINLAKKAIDTQIRPNPFVGAILLDQNEQIIGEGYHQQIGGPHAEVYAIEQALKTTTDLSHSTLYVSLEPCSHFGKTPPCVDLVIRHKIKKVVIASLDPNPKVASVEKLKAHGIEVEVLDEMNAKILNARFFTNQQKQRPYFILKTASTIDGKISDYARKSKWISNPTSRQYVHDQLRSNVDAILTSYKTIIEDQAQLTIRNQQGEVKETNVIIIDKRLTLLKNQYTILPIFYPRNKTTITFIVSEKPDFQLPPHTNYIVGEFDEYGLIFSSVTSQLLELGMYTILTEGGSQLNSSMIQQKVADELYWFIAPAILNDTKALSMLGLDQSCNLEEKVNLTLMEIRKIEEDVLLHYRFKQDLD